jgi:hypothetical protein
MTLRRPTRWMLALAAGCVGALVAVRASAAGDARWVIRPEAVADSSTCSPYDPEAAPAPAELRPFVADGKEPLCAAAADLDGDGREDYVLVLGTQRKYVARPAQPVPAEQKDDLRTVLVLTREADGTLRVAARTEHAAMCAQCGGIFGDPFEGVTARPGEFTLLHYGGSAWRWRADYTFRYQAQTGRWRLERVNSLSYHTSDPDKMETRVHRAPADFAPIDLADFDYETWHGPEAAK